MKTELKKSIKDMMQKYGLSLSQVIKGAHEQNPSHTMLINEIELELTEEQLMGRL